MIYLVKCGGLYKIGHSQNIEARIKEMQVGNPAPLEFVSSWPGGQVLEHNAHKTFEHKRVRGEWFDLNDQDLAALTEYLRPREVKQRRRGRPSLRSYWPRPCHWCARKPRMDSEGQVYCECGWKYTGNHPPRAVA
jgi:hypothetical protein